MVTKTLISAICGALVTAHLIWPEIKIDTTTTILLVIGILPWFASVIRSIELPGGFKIELRDIKTAVEKITAGKTAKALPQSGATGDTSGLSFLSQVAIDDPRLAIVGLRIEIERRLRTLATDLDIDNERRSAGHLLRELVNRERIDRETAAGLADLIGLGNQAAHGTDVEQSAAEWAMDTAPLILEILDDLIARARTPQ